MVQNEVPLLYLYVFRLMTDKFGKVNQMVTSKDLLEIWRRNIYNVPRCYDYHILREMCEYGLLEKVNTQRYKFFGAKSYHKLKKLNDFFLW